MGSGIALCENQIAQIIERDLIEKYYEEQNKLQLFTDDGYEVWRDFSDEVKLYEKIKNIYLYKYNPKIL